MGLWSQATLPDVVCELACAEVETSKRWQPAAIHDQVDQAETNKKRLDIKHSGSLAEPVSRLAEPPLGRLED